MVVGPCTSLRTAFSPVVFASQFTLLFDPVTCTPWAARSIPPRVRVFGRVGSMSQFDELESLSKLGDGEDMMDAKSLAGGEEEDMPPPTGISRRKKQCGACDEKVGSDDWAKDKFRGLLCKRCDNMRGIRVPWLSQAGLIASHVDAEKKVWWAGLCEANPDVGQLPAPVTKETVNKRITHRLRITGGGQTFLMSDAFGKSVDAKELEKVTFMGTTFYGLSAKLDKTPSFLHIVPETLVDIEHCFALDGGEVSVEKNQQKELFQHFSKVEKIADRIPPQRTMQELLDMSGLTWAAVPERFGCEGVSGVNTLPSSSGGGKQGPQEVPAKNRRKQKEEEGEEDDEISEGEKVDKDGKGTEEEEEEEEDNDGDDGADEGRLGNAFDQATLQSQHGQRRGRGTEGGRGAGGANRGRGRGSRRAGGAECARAIRCRGGIASPRAFDARSAKAHGIVQAARDQLKGLCEDNWAQVVTEGNTNATRKEIRHYQEVFASGDPDLSRELESCSFYEGLCPFMAAWRLHRGVLPEEVMVSHFANLEKIKKAVDTHCTVDGWASGLALIYLQSKFFSLVRSASISHSIEQLSLSDFEQNIRRQSSLFKEGMSSAEVEQIIQQKGLERMVSLAVQPLTNKFRDMKQGQVSRLRGTLLKCIEEDYLPVMVGHFRQLKELLSAIVTVMEMGEKKGNWKPSQVKAAIDQIKVGQTSCSLSRTFMTSPGGRQMALDAEASTKKTSQDSGSDLLLKKAMELEGQNLKLLPLTQLELVSSDDYHAEYLQANLTLAVCGQILNTISYAATKLIQAVDGWSPAGLEEQASALGDWGRNVVRFFRAVLARMCSGAGKALGAHIAGLPSDLTDPELEQKLEELKKAADGYQQELAKEKVQDKFDAAVTAFTSYLAKTGGVDGCLEVEGVKVQSKGLTAVLDFVVTIVELGGVGEAPSLDEALQAWMTAGPGDKPYMQKVIDFVNAREELRRAPGEGVVPSLLELQRSALEHGLVAEIQGAHASGNVEEAMMAFKQASCVSACRVQVKAGDIAQSVRIMANADWPELLDAVFDDVGVARTLAKQVNFNEKPSARMASARHERAWSVVAAAISALGDAARPTTLFEGIWDDAVQLGEVHKALEFCSMQSSITSLAMCLVHAYDGCAGDLALVQEGTKDLQFANALRTAQLICDALAGELSAKKSFFPAGQQKQIEGYQLFCQLAAALQARVKASFLSRAVEQCVAKADDMIKACPNWTPVISATNFNLAASKRLFLDSDSVSQVAKGIRVFVLHRGAVEDAFKLLGQDFAVERPDVFENVLDNEIHARLTCAIKSAVNIIANGKNPKRGTLITELYMLLEKQSKSLPKLKASAQSGPKEKRLALPECLKGALDKLKDDDGSGAGSSKRSCTAPRSCTTASSSSTAPAAKRKKQF